MTFEYAPAPESKSIVNIDKQYGHFINGKFVNGKDHFATINPATEEVLSYIANGDKSDIDKAVKAAQLAYTKVWSKLSGAERGKYLYRIARILQERAREFAVLETLDNGKPIRETRDTDIPLVSAHFFYHAGWADKLDYAGVGNKPKAYGVVGQIIPWNFPLLMLAWKVAPALATGNTVVLKPAETTSLTAMLFAEVCQQAELPAGVVNIVTGAGHTGAALVNHPGIAKVAFTGSTEVGKAIARAIADSKKVATLELGGKGANLAEMMRIGIPVPPGFTITTEACKEYLQKGSTPLELEIQITKALRELEDEMQKRLGDKDDPLLVSVRSGAKYSMPGMMETILNVGLNDLSVAGLSKQTNNPRFAWDA